MTKYWAKKYTLDEYEKMTWKTPSDELDDAVEDLLAEVKRLRGGIISILSVYDINDLIREVPEDEWNFEQQALIRLKELIE